MIKIHKLFNSPHGTVESIELLFQPDSLPDYDLLEPVAFSGQLMRMEDGIVFSLKTLSTTLASLCVSCGKPLKLKITSEGSDWFFHQDKPLNPDPADDGFMIDSKHYTIDLLEPVRQEILLNTPDFPRCKKSCRQIEIPDAVEEKGVKAFQNLTDLVNSAKVQK